MAAKGGDPGTCRTVNKACLANDFLAFTAAFNFLIAILNYLGWDVGADVILLTASLGCGGGTRDGHSGA